MTNEQLKNAVTSPWPFFGVSPQGDVLARYIPFGPVFRWRKNQMIPMPVQGSDLCWLLQAADEEGHSITDTDGGRPEA
ncbi:hypothetical protein GBK02_07555 [Dechloromonas sp. TW-R-39-2]|jgi:hypothetical protein|uniref:hypothetical protein n=1 Tax=Dechloromonas TaxID=73029 RepID=UPI00193DE7A2|nr:MULTISPECIES: hypothetical protein [Dechloromonas]QRM19259.1 hypothetical protein GBK02_07555 [Dechloromonas sp. TW-R-39-2]UCV12685.1 hypothetical protein KI614_05590 [Dechloromonas denitrificans]